MLRCRVAASSAARDEPRTPVEGPVVVAGRGAGDDVAHGGNGNPAGRGWSTPFRNGCRSARARRQSPPLTSGEWRVRGGGRMNPLQQPRTARARSSARKTTPRTATGFHLAAAAPWVRHYAQVLAGSAATDTNGFHPRSVARLPQSKEPRPMRKLAAILLLGHRRLCACGGRTYPHR